MSTSSLNASSLLLNLHQFKSQTLQSLLSTSSSDALGQSSSASGGDIFESILAQAKGVGGGESSAGHQALQAASRPTDSVVSAINGLEVSFKAQFSELSELKNTLAQEQQSAQTLSRFDETSSASDIKSALMNFISTYNDGVNRFAPDVEKGGVLEKSQEALRARFSTRRDIADPLIGAFNGLRGGLEAMGITVDPATGIASVDETRLDAILAQDTDADVHTVVDFAKHFMRTTADLNSAGGMQEKQLANLNRAIHWIADNRTKVEQEFGPGQAARPNAAFARAAAAYSAISQA